uniref:Uncharacterized protein n=1 Tax=Timema monikensis TaxID=170555 RepID=A0A7R9E4A0_9NEOP|nr:unnamed protein product [Timema monikensis]
MRPYIKERGGLQYGLESSRIDNISQSDSCRSHDLTCRLKEGTDPEETMSVTLRNVLISDAVDPLCVQLLQEHGVNVTCKYKLPKEELLKEIKKTLSGVRLQASAAIVNG